MKKIAIFQRDLKLGGIQKSLISFLSNIDFNKYEIDLFLFSKEKFFSEEISIKVNIVYLKPLPEWTKLISFSRLIKFKKFKINEKKYDYSIDYDGFQNSTALGALSVNSKHKIIWVHSDYVIRKLEEKKFNILFHFFKNKYSLFNTIVSVSPNSQKSIKQLLKNQNQIFKVIPNYVDANKIIEASKEPTNFQVDSSKYNLCFLGRLSKQKNLKKTLDNILKLTNYRKDFHFYMIGDGNQATTLKKIITKNKLYNHVTLLGRKKNPFKYLAQMDGFILESKYEGQGIVVLEAMVLGLDIFISKNLESNFPNVAGYEDLLPKLKETKKRRKKPYNNFCEYNDKIKQKIINLFNM